MVPQMVVLLNTVKKGAEFPGEFWSVLLGRPKSDLLFAQKAHFIVLFDLLFDCQQVVDLFFDLLFDLFNLWTSGCSF